MRMLLFHPAQIVIIPLGKMTPNVDETRPFIVQRTKEYKASKPLCFCVNLFCASNRNDSSSLIFFNLLNTDSQRKCIHSQFITPSDLFFQFHRPPFPSRVPKSLDQEIKFSASSPPPPTRGILAKSSSLNSKALLCFIFTQCGFLWISSEQGLQIEEC